VGAECAGGGGFERLFPRHHAWPRAPWLARHSRTAGAAPEPLEDRESEDADDDSDDREPARPPSDDGDERLFPFARLLSLEKVASARLIDGDGDEARKILRDARDRTVVVHYFLDGADGEACPVRVEPSDVPLSQYHIDYEREAAPPPRLRGGHGGLASSAPALRLRVRHAQSGCRVRCRSRRARAQSLSLDPVELYTAPLASGRGLNVLHLHVNSLGDDASLAVVDVRSRPEFAAALEAGDAGEAEAAKAAVDALKREPFACDASGRQLDYKIVADGAKVLGVLVAPDGADDDAMEAPFTETRVPEPGSLVALPDGALGVLRKPMPMGLLITADGEGVTDADVAEDAVDGEDALAKVGFAQSASTFRDHRCRNCGAKCPEALPGLVQVDVVSILAPDASAPPPPEPTPEDDNDLLIALTADVDDASLAAVLEMGFDEQRARFALAATGAREAQTADAAVQWLLARQGEELTPDLLRKRPRARADSAGSLGDRPMVPKLLETRRTTTYPACCVACPEPAVARAHADRVAERARTSARSAADDLTKLESLLKTSKGGPAAMQEARELKANVDDAVEEGKMPPLDPTRAARIDRGLRALAFS